MFHTSSAAFPEQPRSIEDSSVTAESLHAAGDGVTPAGLPLRRPIFPDDNALMEAFSIVWHPSVATSGDLPPRCCRLALCGAGNRRTGCRRP